MNSLIDKLLAKVALIANKPDFKVALIDKVLSKFVLTDEAQACYVVRCEWVPQCSNNNGGCDYYESKVCLTSCGYWYDTGETRKWRSVPYCSC